MNKLGTIQNNLKTVAGEMDNFISYMETAGVDHEFMIGIRSKMEEAIKGCTLVAMEQYSSNRTIEALKAKMEKAERTTTSLELEVISSALSILELKDTNSDLENQLAGLRVDTDKMNSENNDLLLWHERLKENNSYYKDRLDQLRNANAEVAEKNRTLKAELMEAKRVALTATAECAMLNDYVEKLETDRKFLTDESLRMANRMSEKDAEIAELKKKLADLSEREVAVTDVEENAVCHYCSERFALGRATTEGSLYCCQKCIDEMLEDVEF